MRLLFTTSRGKEGRGRAHRGRRRFTLIELPVASRRKRAAFTLIELLVVVAIIAMLISILLPSLSRARDQARATLCAARISQLCKAMFPYGDDFNGALPFLGRGWEDADDPGQDSRIWPKFPGRTTTVRDWKYLEDWLMPNMPDYWAQPQIDWPDYAQVRNGRLFSYTRFETLYRCPTFERVGDTRKSQNVFNYTRSFLGRKWYHTNEPEGQTGSPWYFGNWAGAAGPIVRIDQAFSPARLEMFFDERWDRHCAGPAEELVPPVTAGKGLLQDMIVGQWMVVDCLFGILGDEIGQYHGQKMPSQLAPPDYKVPPVKRGNVAYYDGHVELVLDPLPDRNIDVAMGLVPAINMAVKLFEWVYGHVHAQRGPTNIVFTLPF